MSVDRTPLYVRLGETETRQLEQAVAVSGKSKRQLVEEAVREHITDDGLVVGSVVMHGEGPVVGRVSLNEAAAEVMTLTEAAMFLRLEEDAVAEAAARGELPGRRIADHWRFSRAALLDWLAAGSA
jgi:excisionase family DNA binding protein